MASAGITPMGLVVTDGVAPSIAPNLQKIATASRDADAAVQSLKSSLSSISSTQNLGQQLRSVASSTTQLNNAVTKFGNSSSTASTQVLKFASSVNTLDFAMQSAIKTFAAFTAGANAAQISGRALGTSMTGAGAGAGQAANGALAARAAIQTLEGSTMGAARAGGVFLASTLGLGRALQAAFPVIGALALLEVLSQLVSGIEGVIDAYKRLDIQTAKSEAEQIRAGNRILKVKPDHSLFSKEGMAELFKGGGPLDEDVLIKNSRAIVRDLEFEKKKLEAQNRYNEAGLVGEALQKQKTADLQAMQNLIDRQRTAVKALADEYQNLYSSSRVVAPTGGAGSFAANKFGIAQGTPAPVSVLNLTQAQQKQVGNELENVGQLARDLDEEFDILGKDIKTSMKKEPIGAMHDALKAARIQAKLFEDELGKFKQTDQIRSPQATLEFFQQQRAVALPPNQAGLDIKIGNVTQEIDRQERALDLLAERYHDQVSAIGLYSDAKRIEAVQDKIDIDLKKQGIATNTAKALQAKEDAATAIRQAVYQKELQRIYTEFNEPLRTYEAGLQAVSKLEKDGAIGATQAAIARNQLNKSYIDAINPLAEYAHGIQNEIALFGQYGEKLRIATEIQRVQNDLRNKGRSLTQQELQQLTAFLTQLDRLKQVESAINTSYEQNAGRLQTLAIQYAAVTEARKKGIISEEQERLELSKVKVELADLAIQLGKLSASGVLTSVFGNYIKQFQGFTKSVVGLWQQTFTTIADGAANSLGRAIAYGENLGKALKDVARQALSELIAGMIKLGIQMLIQAVIGRTIAAGTLAVTETVAAAAALAWAPAAAYASLATLGSNAAPADAALISTVALAEIMSVAHFNKGGFVGGVGSSDTVPAVLTPGEFVMTQAATRANRSLLESLNAGQSVGSLGSDSPFAVNVTVLHDGSTGVQVEHISENEIRVIAKQEAKQAVQSHAPSVIAGEISNPNSQVSKSIGRHTDTRRAR